MLGICWSLRLSNILCRIFSLISYNPFFPLRRTLLLATPSSFSGPALSTTYKWAFSLGPLAGIWESVGANIPHFQSGKTAVTSTKSAPTPDPEDKPQPESKPPPTAIQLLLDNPALFSPTLKPRNPIVLCHGELF